MKKQPRIARKKGVTLKGNISANRRTRKGLKAQQFVGNQKVKSNRRLRKRPSEPSSVVNIRKKCVEYEESNIVAAPTDDCQKPIIESVKLESDPPDAAHIERSCAPQLGVGGGESNYGDLFNAAAPNEKSCKPFMAPKLINQPILPYYGSDKFRGLPRNVYAPVYNNAADAGQSNFVDASETLCQYGSYGTVSKTWTVPIANSDGSPTVHIQDGVHGWTTSQNDESHQNMTVPYGYQCGPTTEDKFDQAVGNEWTAERIWKDGSGRAAHSESQFEQFPTTMSRSQTVIRRKSAGNCLRSQMHGRFTGNGQRPPIRMAAFAKPPPLLPPPVLPPSTPPIRRNEHRSMMVSGATGNRAEGLRGRVSRSLFRAARCAYCRVPRTQCVCNKSPITHDYIDCYEDAAVRGETVSSGAVDHQTDDRPTHESVHVERHHFDISEQPRAAADYTPSTNTTSLQQFPLVDGGNCTTCQLIMKVVQSHEHLHLDAEKNDVNDIVATKARKAQHKRNASGLRRLYYRRDNGESAQGMPVTNIRSEQEMAGNCRTYGEHLDSSAASQPYRDDALPVEDVDQGTSHMHACCNFCTNMTETMLELFNEIVEHEELEDD